MRKLPCILPAIATAYLLLGWTDAGERSATADDDRAVTGVVKFDGPRPKPKAIRMIEKGGKLSNCHKLHKSPLLDQNVIVSEKGEVANAFVYIRKGAPKQDYPVPKKPALLNQVKCMFLPRVQGVRVGQEFVMKNGDPVIHNIRTFSFKNRPFNFAQPASSEDRKKVFTKVERAVMIQCDLHPWMKAYFFVLDHPYFAVTDKTGQFQIKGLPAGDYTIEAWHEEFGRETAKLTVGKSGQAQVNFSFKPKQEDDSGS